MTCRHIGIVAVSPEGSSLCYRDIFRAAKRIHGERGHPTVTLHNIPFERYLAAVVKDDWHAVGDMLAQSARVLAAAGAEFCIVPDNLMQYGVHLAEHQSPIPYLTMTELVGEAIVRDKRHVVGLIGTKLVMFGSTYQTHLGLKGVQVLVPDAAEADMLDSIIFGELVYGVVVPESQKRVLRVIEHLEGLGCEGVILGCSEAPLMITAQNSPVPVYDPIDLLAEGALRCALGERPLKGLK